MRSFPTLVLAGALLATAAHAAPPSAEGAKIAAEGTADGSVPACEGCHGAGEGNFPLLAGQEQGYLLLQLEYFRSGRRSNEMMAPIAQALTPKQGEAVAGWYAAQKKRRAAADKPAAKLLARGEIIANEGLPGQQVLPCLRCHAEDAIENFANLDGQNPDYVVEQLQAFRERKRTPINPMMNGVARNLTDDDARAIAAYYLERVKAEKGK